jgi:hypothetical protein
MNSVDYFGLVSQALSRVEELQTQREVIDTEIMKQEQFITATANFLIDEQRDLVLKRLEIIRDLQRVRESSLTESVRFVLGKADEWLTTSQVRDRLIALGFDFSLYSTNPLASVSTTLRRMKFEEVETRTTSDGITAYRWKNRKAIAKAAAIKLGIERQRTGIPPPPRLVDVIEESLNKGKK